MMDRSLDFDALDLDSNRHPLLEPQTPKYSNLTIRRAYIVWLRCGQKNEFRDVCNYYHRLEIYENTLPEYTRAISRHHEFSLFITDPPTSPYQMSLFPNLYSAPHQPSYNLPLYHQIYIQPQPRSTITYIHQKAVVIEEKRRSVIPVKLEKRKPSKVSDEEIFEASQAFKTPVEPLTYRTELDIREVKFPEVCDQLNEECCELTNDEYNEMLDDEFGELVNKDHSESNELAINISNKQAINHLDEQTTDDSNKKKNDVPQKDIIKTIQRVQNYCKEMGTPVRNFWHNFNEHASICQLSNSVYNVTSYVNNKMVESELPMALFVLKVSSHEKRNNLTSPKEENITVKAPANETKDSPSTSHKPVEVEIKVDQHTEIERDDFRKVSELNENLISFVDRLTREQEEKITKLFEEASLGFTNTDEDEPDDASECRKI